MKKQPSHLYLGVDPGAKGGLALLDDSNQIVSLLVMPKRSRDIMSWVEFRLLEVPRLTIAVEKVGSMPRQNVKAIFTFGRNYEKCLTVLDILEGYRKEDGLETTVTHPTPQIWQSHLHLEKVVNDFKNKTHWKRYLRSKAIELYPDNPIWNSGTESSKDAVSDALLIAHYAKSH